MGNLKNLILGAGFVAAIMSSCSGNQTLSGLDRRAGELLKETLDAQEDPAALLGEDGQIPEKLRQELRTQALRDALAEPKTVTAQITFQLIEQDGQWWALPDQAMLDILSGGLG